MTELKDLNCSEEQPLIQADTRDNAIQNYRTRESFIFQLYKASYRVDDDVIKNLADVGSDHSDSDSGVEDEESHLKSTAEIEPVQPSPCLPIRQFSLGLVKLTTKHALVRWLLLYAIPILYMTFLSFSPYPKDPETKKVSFWYFLFVFFGSYLAVLISFTTFLFQLYCINWWPEKQGLKYHAMIWSGLMAVGVLAYFVNLAKYKLIWVFLASFTMLIPLFLAWKTIRAKRKEVYRNTFFTDAEITFADFRSNWMPTSYNQFIWFVIYFLAAYIAFCVAEYISYIYLTAKPANKLEHLIYANSFMIALSVLNGLSERIIFTKIGLRPIQEVTSMYFQAFTFTFYRTLFVKLDSAWEFILVQVIGSLAHFAWFNITTTRYAFSILTRFWNEEFSYPQHLKRMGRFYFIRTITENVSIIIFLIWINAFRFGPNADSYPYFKYLLNDFPIVIMGTAGIWLVERIIAISMRLSFRKIFLHDITEEAVKDFKKYPELVPLIIIILIHVPQSMLLALFNLNFQ